MDAEPKKKEHRKRQAGPKAKKKKQKNENEGEKHRNVKAFTFQSAVRAERSVRRMLDREAKKHHAPVVDRAPLELPPVVVAVVGPPKVGKSTLITCLLKNYTRQNLTDVKGPVTVVSGKKRRLTLIECPNDINSMIDVGKIADVVLLLIDASFGFEMETFEFLNILQAHGFPKVMGVLTHLDIFKNQKTVKKVKKALKQRFWTEVQQGAKVFYLSGLVHGQYPKVEVHNLARFISVMKFRPLEFRTSHPYALIDRVEDLTHGELIRENPKVDRTVALYGYVRGIPLHPRSKFHMPGCGDFPIQDLSILPDPCPLPDKLKKRSLNEKEKMIYAPMSGVGGIVYDKDAVYIDLGGSHHVTSDRRREKGKNPEVPNSLVASLMSNQSTIDAKMESSELTLLKESQSALKKDGSPTEENDAETEDSAPISGGSHGNAEEADDGSIGSHGNTEDEDGSIGSHGNTEEDDDGGITPVEGTGFKPLARTKQKRKKLKKSDQSANNAESDDAMDIEEFIDDEAIEDNTNVDFEIDYQPEHSSHLDDDSDHSGFFDEEAIEDNRNLEFDEDYSAQEEGEGDEKSSSGSEGSGSEETGSEDSGSEETGSEDLGSEDTENETLNDSEDNEEGDDSFVTSGIEFESAEDSLEQLDDLAEKVNTRKRGAYFLEDETSDHESEQSEQVEEEDASCSSSEESISDDDDLTDDSQVNENERSDGALKWKSSLMFKAATSFLYRQQARLDMQKLVYEPETLQLKSKGASNEPGADEIAGLFKAKVPQADSRNARDVNQKSLDVIHDWENPDVIASLKGLMVTGKWAPEEDAQTLLDADEELYGDFEDLETGQVFHKSQSDSEEEVEEGEDGEKMLEKKLRIKEAFDKEYDDNAGNEKDYFTDLKESLSKQAELNRKEFEDIDEKLRLQMVGAESGKYIRIEVQKMPCEFIEHLNPQLPIILGGLLPGETKLGYITVRIKHHRWYKRLLKSRDPLIFSIGWRRFQSNPVFFKMEDNFRQRFLKYTPEHLHCCATLYGPLSAPGAGFIGVQSTSQTTSDFRISATGTIMENDQSSRIVKKLKLVGRPYKIFKNTAFIKDMFNSELEVAKFEGATIRTVSGIRGQIKKALRTPQGAFRATFEDKLLMSDLVFVRSWFPVQIPKFYNLITSLLSSWLEMRTVGKIRYDTKTKAPVKRDSIYRPIERETRHFNPLRISKALQKNLPFKSKPKFRHNSLRQRMLSKARAVILEPHEKKVVTFLQHLSTLNKDKIRKQKSKRKEEKKAHLARKVKQEEKLNSRVKRERKEFYRLLGKQKHSNKS